MRSKLLLSLIFICSFLLISCESEQARMARLQQEKNAKLQSLRLAQGQYDTVNHLVKTGEVKSGQGMFQALLDVGFSRVQSLKVIDQLSDYVEFSKLKVGDKLVATFHANGLPIQFEFSNNPAEKHILVKDFVADKWTYSFLQEPTEWKTRLITGSLSPGSTLQNDLLAQGISRRVVGEIVDILLCKINFRIYARSGDQFEVLLNERHFKEQILETRILYTSYSGVKTGTSQAYFYEDDESQSTYTAHYTEQGEALIRAGLRYPLKRLHIRSNYGRRRHPVTGRVTMHRGVDLSGRTGDPVYAVARGIVVESKMTEYGGNKVAIRHADRSISYYLHLNKRMVNVGQSVLAHQQIGTVGATGRVTGPHLHFGFKKPNGHWMNPLNKRMIATPKLKGEKLARLKNQISDIKKLLAKTLIAQTTETQNEKRL